MKQTFINLLKEICDNTIVYKTMDKTYTAVDMIHEIENNTEIGYYFINEILRISRDLLIRQERNKP